MRAHSVHGNGNTATLRDVTIVDGALYRLPSGDLVRASVVPHPDALPEYWSETPDGTDAWPIAHDLRLCLVWPDDSIGADTVGPAQLTFLTAACVAGVRWADGSYVFDVDSTPELVRKKGQEGHGPGWHLEDLAPLGAEVEAEFEQAVQRAQRAWRRLLSFKELLDHDRSPAP